MRRTLDKRGSSSVLIILILLCLTTFSVLAVMSAYSDVKLARKNLSSARSYYALDSLGERRLAEINAMMEAADEGAAQYIRESGYLAPSNAITSLELARNLFERYRNSVPASAELAQIRGEVAAELFQASFLENALEIESISPSEGSPFLFYYVTHDHPDYPGKHLTIELEFSPDTTGHVSYSVVSWFQWQDAFEYEGAVYELWDGS